MIFALPKIVYTTESKYNGRIDVFEHKGHYRIAVGNTTQSLSSDAQHAIKGTWGKIADLVLVEHPAAREILVLGLGGGTVVHLLSEKLPEAKITGVEIDSEMVDIAKKFFKLDSIPNLNLIVADAFGVLSDPQNYNLSEKSFDVVIIDIYHGEKFPDLGKSGAFFANLKKLVKPDGLVVFNRIYLEHHQVEVDEFADLLRQFFTDVKKLLVAGRSNSDNILIYGRA